MKARSFFWSTLCVVLIAGISVIGCNKDQAAALANSFGIAMPAMVITSPTATSSRGTRGLFSLRDDTVPTDVKPFKDMVNEFKNDINSDPLLIAAKLQNFLNKKSFRAACFGPSWHDDAVGSDTNRPSGDLGIVAANASPTDDSACAAAQLNALVGGAPQLLNKLLQLQAMTLATASKEGKALPAIGAEVDEKASMPSIPGYTFDSATISRLADRTSDSRPVYKTAITFTDTASALSGYAKVYHTPVTDDNASFEGLIQVVVPSGTTSRATRYRGISVVYSQSAGTLTYALDTAANQGTNDDDFFGTNGRVNFTKTAFGEDGNRVIAQFNADTGLATMHFAWQAGRNDLASRVFAISIPAGTLGSRTGVAYFGFGATVQTLTDDTSSLWATNMRCNWVNDATQHINKVQMQSMSESATKFSSTATAISFAPTNDCNALASTWTVTSSQPSGYDGTHTGGYPTNDLVTPPASTATDGIPAITVPAYAVPTR